MDNAVHLTGNLAADPELRFGASGKPFANFTVVINNRRKNESTGEWEDGDAKFFDCTCFGTLAERMSESLGRGQRVTLNGKLDQQKWEDRDTGAARSKVVVIADSVGPDLRWANVEVTKYTD